jgi:hypothetical protein
MCDLETWNETAVRQRKIIIGNRKMTDMPTLLTVMYGYGFFIDYSKFSFGATAPQWAMASSFTRFLDHTQRCTTFGRTPLDE